MMRILKLSCNIISTLGLSLVLLSCTTEHIVSPHEPISFPVTETPTIPLTPSTTSTPTVPPTEPNSLVVIVDFSNENCDCKGNFKTTNIKIHIKDGELPFNVNGEFPVNNRFVTFPVTPGSPFELAITSFDKRVYEASFDVPIPSSCQPPKSCNNGGNGGNGGGCTEKEVQDCKDVITTVDVCVKWTGNDKKCLEWEQKQTVNKVCETKVVCE